MPITKNNGRIHTSTTTVAVLPKPNKINIQINNKNLKINIYHTNKTKKQHINTTDSTVRITHLPTKLVITQQNKHNQHKNHTKTIQVLRTQLFNLKHTKTHNTKTKTHKTIINSNDRSKHIQTYNFPQNQITNHRIGLTLHKLPKILKNHKLNKLINTLITKNKTKHLTTINK